MIIFAENKHKEAITEVWNEAFGDTEEDILKYLDTILKYVLVFEEEGKVCGILTLLPVKLGEKKGRYVYAVATLKECRGRGISTALLEYTKEYIKENGEEFLILVPQNDGLFDFYKKRGFETVCNIVRKELSVQETEKEGFSAEKITAGEYEILREKILEDKNLVEWGADMLLFAKEMYEGDFYRVTQNDKEKGIAFCFTYDKVLHIKELCGEEDCIVAAIATKFKPEVVRYTLSGETGMPYAMMYPKLYDSVYFAVALD